MDDDDEDDDPTARSGSTSEDGAGQDAASDGDEDDDPTARSASASEDAASEEDGDDDQTVVSPGAVEPVGTDEPVDTDEAPAAASPVEVDDDGTVGSPSAAREEDPDDTFALEVGDTTAARADDDPTALIGHGGEGAAPSPEAPRVKPTIASARPRRRAVLKPAPVPPGYGGRAIVAPGVGAVSTYGVRAIPRPPASAQAFPHRSVSRLSADLPSAARRSRRLSLLALGVFGVSIVVSATGLVLILRSAILGY